MIHLLHFTGTGVAPPVNNPAGYSSLGKPGHSRRSRQSLENYTYMPVTINFTSNVTCLAYHFVQLERVTACRLAQSIRGGRTTDQIVIKKKGRQPGCGKYRRHRQVAEGLTAITYRANVKLFEELAAPKHSLVPDALEKESEAA
jgi:hypothetical protein